MEIKGMDVSKTTWMRASWCLAAALAVGGVARADDATDGDGTWASRAQLGYAKTGGNTDTTSANALFHIAHTWEQWKFLFGVDGYYGSTAGQTTAQSWDGYLQANYNITDRLYWFGKLSDLENKFSGFAYQRVISTGVGYQFIKTDTTKLAAQIGIGERRLQPLDLTLNDIGAITSVVYLGSETDTVVDGQVNFEHSFNSITKILAAYEIDSGSNNTMQTGNIALQVKMSDRLGLSLSYQLVTNSKPPPGVGRSSSLESVSLVYALKNKNLAPE
jgi:putative salt-induced outer membrane protein